MKRYLFMRSPMQRKCVAKSAHGEHGEQGKIDFPCSIKKLYNDDCSTILRPPDDKRSLSPPKLHSPEYRGFLYLLPYRIFSYLLWKLLA